MIIEIIINIKSLCKVLKLVNETWNYNVFGLGHIGKRGCSFRRTFNNKYCKICYDIINRIVQKIKSALWPESVVHSITQNMIPDHTQMKHNYLHNHTQLTHPYRHRT